MNWNPLHWQTPVKVGLVLVLALIGVNAYLWVIV